MKIKHPKSDEKLNRQLVPKRKNSFCSYQPLLAKLIITLSTPFITTQSDVSSQFSDGVVSIPDKPKTPYGNVQFINNDMFVIISNLLILDGFTDYSYQFVIEKNYICLVINDNDEDMDEDGEFLWDKIDEGYAFNFLFKISTNLEVPELHFNWRINVNSFKLILNILDKMNVKIYFIVDLDYNWTNIKTNFKLIYLALSNMLRLILFYLHGMEIR